jgi:hypothetical protein
MRLYCSKLDLPHLSHRRRHRSQRRLLVPEDIVHRPSGDEADMLREVLDEAGEEEDGEEEGECACGCKGVNISYQVSVGASCKIWSIEQ